MKDVYAVIVGIICFFVFLAVVIVYYKHQENKCIDTVKDKPAAEIRILCRN